MTNAAIFLYGTVVFTLVATALGVLAWGIVTERRSRLELEAEQRLTSRQAAL